MRRLYLWCLCAYIFGLTSGGTVKIFSDKKAPPKDNLVDSGKPLRFVVVGDSTVARPKMHRWDLCGGGWGSGFLNTLKTAGPDSGVNLGLCGASTVSYMATGHWATAMTIIHEFSIEEKAQTFVVIGFGRNDQKQLIPEATTFNSLRRYIADVRSLNAIPIVVSPVSYTNIAPDGTIKKSLRFEQGINYHAAKNVSATYLDLTMASRLRFLQDGYKRVMTYRLHPLDSTHLNLQGARAVGDVVCKLFVEALPQFAKHFRCS